MRLTSGARCAGIAGVEGHSCDTLTDNKTLHVGPDRYDLTTELVPHHLARLDESAAGIRMQVAPTDATGFDAYHDVVNSRLRIGDGLYTYGTDAFEDRSLHR